MTLSRRCFLSSSAALIGSLPRVAWSSTNPYPDRLVRVIVPFAPGGPTDVAGRLVAEGLTAHFHRQFIVENVAGAGGNIGVAQVARAPADGHTILIAAPSYAANPSLFERVPYDPHKDFRPVTIAATSSTALVVHPSIEARTVDELVALIKARPNTFSFASPGIGTPPHLLGELFRLSFKLDVVHAPFNGGAPAIASTLAGHTQISFTAIQPAVQHVKEGKLRALAITSRSRASVLPDVPSITEAGYPDIVADIWQAVLVPAGTSDQIVNDLHNAIASSMTQSPLRDRMAAVGFSPVLGSPLESDATLRREIEKWGRVIRQAQIKIQ